MKAKRNSSKGPVKGPFLLRARSCSQSKRPFFVVGAVVRRAVRAPEYIPAAYIASRSKQARRSWQPGSVPAGLASDLTRDCSGAALVPRGVYASHSHPSIKGKRPADLAASPGNRRRKRALFMSSNRSKSRARDSRKRANK